MNSTHNYDWNNFINFSEKLLEEITSARCNKETVYRTICSRAYYGIFKLIEDFCRENSIPLPGRDELGNKLGSHKKIMIYLQECNRELYILISRLYNKRISADYRKYIKVTGRNAELSIRDAKRAKALFDEDKANWDGEYAL